MCGKSVFCYTKYMSEEWDAIKEQLESSERKIKIVEGESPRSSIVLNWAKVRPEADLAAVVENCEQIVVDDWIHVFGHGKGSDGQTIFILSSLADGDFMKNGLVVAKDVLGGLFAICRDEKDDTYGGIYYLEPEYLDWEYSGMDYSQFLIWLAHDNLDAFYEDVRWENWRDIASRIDMDSCLKFTPDVWMEDCDFSASPRQIVPFKKQLDEELAAYLEKYKGDKTGSK